MQNYIKKLINKIRSLKTNTTYSVTQEDNDADKYCNDRHNQYDTTTLKGVGDSSKSEDLNYAEYESAKYIFVFKKIK